MRFNANYSSVAKGKELYFAGMLHNHFFSMSLEHNTVLNGWEVSEGKNRKYT